MQRAGMNAEIVDEAAASGQQRRIFDTRDRLADPRRAGLRTGNAWPAASAIPNVSPAQMLLRQETLFSRVAGPAIPADLETYHRVSFRRRCAAQHQLASRETFRNSRASYAAVVAEEAGEMRRFGKAELVADIADVRGLIEHRVDSLLHPHDIQIDLRRHTDRRLEQPEEMRARQSCIPAQKYRGRHRVRFRTAWRPRPCGYASRRRVRSSPGSRPENFATA